jgi:hypothetical protein
MNSAFYIKKNLNRNPKKGEMEKIDERKRMEKEE